MIPIDQTKFGLPDGNCMSAAVASVLEIPLDVVPSLCGPDWYPKLRRWLWQTHRLVPVVVDRWPQGDTGYAIGLGLGPRGLNHAVVVQDGYIVHDPHPSRAGLVYLDSYLLFVEPD